MNHITHEALRYIVVLATMPLWTPFVRAVWKELNRALRYEGGLFGKRPTPAQVREIERAARFEESPLVHEPFARPGASNGRPRFRSNAPQAGRGAQSGRDLPRGGMAPQSGASRPGFARRGGARPGGFR